MSQKQIPSTPPGVSDSEHAQIVAEVLADQARRSAVRDAAAPRPNEGDVSFFVQVGLLVTGTFFFYLLFFSPTWVAPTAPEPMSATQVEDGLRFQISLTASQIKAFGEEQGRFPANLEEAGVERDDIEYRRLGPETFEVIGRTGPTSLRYVSTQPLEEFLGDAPSRILGGTS